MMGAAAAAARAAATESVARCFAYIRSLMGVDFTDTDEKEILAQGELMSTALMNNYLHMTGTRSVLLPALKFMWFTDLFLDYVPMYAKFRTVASILVIAEFPCLGIWRGYSHRSKPWRECASFRFGCRRHIRRARPWRCRLARARFRKAILGCPVRPCTKQPVAVRVLRSTSTSSTRASIPITSSLSGVPVRRAAVRRSLPSPAA